MTAKTTFFNHSFYTLKQAIIDIDPEEAKDIYALSLFYYADGDDLRYPVIELSYNTQQNLAAEINHASNMMEAKWNYAFWLQDDIASIGGREDDLLKNWSSQYAALDEQERQFNQAFIEGVIVIAQRLFAENVIRQKFGENIPIIIHELEYYDEPIKWTKSVNPPEIMTEFLLAYQQNEI